MPSTQNNLHVFIKCYFIRERLFLKWLRILVFLFTSSLVEYEEGGKGGEGEVLITFHGQ